MGYYLWEDTEGVNTEQWMSVSTWAHFKITTQQTPDTGNFLRWYTVRSLITYNLWPLPVIRLVPCWPLCTISNCELIKSKQNSGSMPVASGQTDFIQSSTKHCVSFCDIFLVFLGFLGSSIAEKLFETSHYSCRQQVWGCQIIWRRKKDLLQKLTGQILN